MDSTHPFRRIRNALAVIAFISGMPAIASAANELVGDSILSFDPVRRQWQQTWITNRGSNMVLWGELRDRALVLEGEVHLHDGTTILQRITWRTEGDAVRESAVLSRDAGATWEPAFDVIFRKRDAR